MGIASFSNSAALRWAGADGGGAGVSAEDCAADAGVEAGGLDVPEAEFFGGWFVCCAATASAKTKLQQTVNGIEQIRFINR